MLLQRDAWRESKKLRNLTKELEYNAKVIRALRETRPNTTEVDRNEMVYPECRFSSKFRPVGLCAVPITMRPMQLRLKAHADKSAEFAEETAAQLMQLRQQTARAAPAQTVTAEDLSQQLHPGLVEAQRELSAIKEQLAETQAATVDVQTHDAAVDARRKMAAALEEAWAREEGHEDAVRALQNEIAALKDSLDAAENKAKRSIRRLTVERLASIDASSTDTSMAGLASDVDDDGLAAEPEPEPAANQAEHSLREQLDESIRAQDKLTDSLRTAWKREEETEKLLATRTEAVESLEACLQRTSSTQEAQVNTN